MGIVLPSYRNCPLDVWRFCTTRHYHICHRSGLLGDRRGLYASFQTVPLPKRQLEGSFPRLRCNCDFLQSSRQIRIPSRDRQQASVRTPQTTLNGLKRERPCDLRHFHDVFKNDRRITSLNLIARESLAGLAVRIIRMSHLARGRSCFRTDSPTDRAEMDLHR